MSVKALGIALKLTLSGMNQLIFPQTWAFAIVVITCVITQMNYLNMVMMSFLSLPFVSCRSFSPNFHFLLYQILVGNYLFKFILTL